MSKPDKALLTCPRCGHQQLEARSAFSANCRKCGAYWRVQDLLKPPPKAPPAAPEQKRIACFDCGTEFDVPATAQSTMCKRCSTYIDLHDYSIANAVSKNFKTRGTFVIQPTGYVFNCEAIVTEAVIKGRFIGKLMAERSLTLYSTAQLKGSFVAARLIVPAGNQVRWNGAIQVKVAEIHGELCSELVTQSIEVKSGGRVFGNIEAQSVTVEYGGVLEGHAKIGPSLGSPRT